MLVSAQDLEALFNPRGIVFVGMVDAGSLYVERSRRLGRPFCYVNPKQTSSEAGVPVYHDLAEVPDTYDVAIIRLSAAGVPDAVDACARRGIRGIFVISSGFSEAGPEGRIIQARLA